MENFDLVVIGAGPGGYPAAIRAAQLGSSVAIVEREEFGGTCLNWGCIPTKLFLETAKLYHGARKSEVFGIQGFGLNLDYSTLANYKDKTIGKLRGGVGQLLKANGVKIFKGTASFQNHDQIQVSALDTEPVELSAAAFIIATGSTSVMPGALPQHERIVESRAFLALKKMPSRLLVLGGGYIGCELACMAAELGRQVTLVELQTDILVGLDLDVRREVRRSMESQLGIRVITGQELKDVRATEENVSARAGDTNIEADLLLVAIGRKPVTDALMLENAGLHTNERGCITVDEFCQTSVPNIYAIGDVNGLAQLAHAATSQGMIAASHAAGKAVEPNEYLIPGVIFTSPEVGVVGITEIEAQKRSLPVKVGRFPFSSLGRSIAIGNSVGFAKWIACADTDKLLGAAVVGPNATELIAEATIAIRCGVKAEELGRTVHAHPTFGEIWMEAAHAVHGMAIHAPPARRLQHTS